jgi:hypothetical protein
MTQRMTCHEYDALLARDLEGELSLEERRSADAHLIDCSRCSTLRAELLGIAAAARELPLISPSRDLWDGIAARIDAPVLALQPAAGRSAGGRRLRMLAAAAALVAATAGTTYVITRASFGSGESQIAGTQPDDASPRVGDSAGHAGVVLASDTATNAADAAFDREVVQLRALLEQRRPNLDSATVAILERNLRIIDQAIAESRAALEKDPGSVLLNRQLHNALGKKVQVLRTAALLPIETN